VTGAPTPGGCPLADLGRSVTAAFGAIDQYFGAQYSPFLIEVSGLSAPWLLVPFLAGASQPAARPAALLGWATTWLAIVAYTFMEFSPVEGTQLTPHAYLACLVRQWPWIAGGLLTGPLYGWLGHRFRAHRSWAAGLLAALPVFLEPAGRWLTTDLGLDRLARWQFSWPPAGLGHGAVTAMLAEACLGLLLLAVMTAVARRGANAA
jgi:hypothetical protein